MVSLKDGEFRVIHKNFTWRGLLIALCMCFFDPRYLWIGNLKERIGLVHMSNYVPDKVPILKAARHCTKVWRYNYYLVCSGMPDNIFYEE